MRTVRALVVSSLSAFALAGLCGCEPPAVCGDGVVQPGEDEQTCCLDVGCAFGGCDEQQRRCVDAWTSACAGGEGCVGDGPYRCGDDEAPPAYDCGACGCPDDGRCEGGACWSLDEIRARRDAAEVPTDLDVEAYFTLFEELARAPLTLAELLTQAAAEARADRRRGVALLALSTGAARERRLGERLLAELGAAGLSVDDGLSFLEEALDEEACASVEALVSGRLSDDGLVSVTATADVGHRESCFYEEQFPRCQPPTLDGCVLRAGRLPLSFLVVDFGASLDVVDRALLIRSTNRPAGERLFHLDGAITEWRQRIETWPTPGEHTIDLDGAPVTLRARASARYDATWWVSLSARGKPPFGLIGYRLLWVDGATQSFLLEHDIVGRDCVWSEGDEGVVYECENAGASVRALFDPTTLALVSVERLAP